MATTGGAVSSPGTVQYGHLSDDDTLARTTSTVSRSCTSMAYSTFVLDYHTNLIQNIPHTTQCTAFYPRRSYHHTDNVRATAVWTCGSVWLDQKTSAASCWCVSIYIDYVYYTSAGDVAARAAGDWLHPRWLHPRCRGRR